MAEHTPGDWEALPPAREGKHWKVVVNGTLGGKSSMAGASVQWFVAQIHNGAPGDTLETEEANAYLIAAAPKMLAALRSVAYHIHMAATNEAENPEITLGTAEEVLAAIAATVPPSAPRRKRGRQ